MPDDGLEKANDKSMAELMRIASEENHVLDSRSLGALLQQQLSMPIEFELNHLNPAAAARLREVCTSRGLSLKSLGDVVFHPQPPVELLRMIKEYAAACHSHPESAIPRDVASVLYFLSIVVAMLRCNERITALDNASLRTAIRWLVQQPWVDEPVRMLLAQGLARIEAEDGPASSAGS